MMNMPRSRTYFRPVSAADQSAMRNASIRRSNQELAQVYSVQQSTDPRFMPEEDIDYMRRHLPHLPPTSVDMYGDEAMMRELDDKVQQLR